MKHLNRIVSAFIPFSIGIIVLFMLVSPATPVHAAGDGSVALFNPLASTVDPEAPIQSLSAIFINTLFGIAGSIALAMFVWGGVLWLTSAGNEKQVAKGRGVIQWTTLGMIMMFASYTLVSYLFSSFGTGAVGGATGGAGGTGGGGTGGTGAGSSKCCVDYSNNSAKTVSDPASCTGSQAKIFDGACEGMQFCGADPSFTGPTLPCAPVPSAVGCGSLSAFTSFNQCIIAQVPASGPPKAATQYYCCMNAAKTKFTQISATDDNDAAKKCGAKSYTKYAAGECTTSLINSLK